MSWVLALRPHLLTPNLPASVVYFKNEETEIHTYIMFILIFHWSVLSVGHLKPGSGEEC